MGRDSWVTIHSRGGEFVSEVIIVGFSRKGEASISTRHGLVVALSSGARRLLFSIIYVAWGCLFPLAGFGLLSLLGVRFVLRVLVHEGLLA